MPKFISSPGLTIEFRVVRAYPTNPDVQKQYGIFANFSAKTIAIQDGVETVLMSHNSLMLCTNRDGNPYVGSKHEDDPSGQRIFFTALYPGVVISSDQKLKETSQKFMEDLTREIREFIVTAKKNLERREQDRLANVPPALRDLGKLGIVKDKPKAKTTKNTDNLPI